jgi:hypothetical protein
LAAKQEQMARNIAMPQTAADEQGDEEIRPRLASPPSSRPASLPRPKKVPLVASKQSAAQSASAPLPAPVHFPFLDGSH